MKRNTNVGVSRRPEINLHDRPSDRGGAAVAVEVEVVAVAVAVAEGAAAYEGTRFTFRLNSS